MMVGHARYFAESRLAFPWQCDEKLHLAMLSRKDSVSKGDARIILALALLGNPKSLP